MKATISVLISIICIFNFSSVKSQVATTVDDFKVFDVYGNMFRLYDILDEGKYVFIQFFSNGCGSCQTEAPIVNDVYKDLGCNNSDIYFIGIDFGSNNNDIIQFMSEFGIQYQTASGFEGGGNAIFTLCNISYTPYSLMISPNREIVLEEPEFYDSQTLKNLVMSFGITENLCKGTDFLMFNLETVNNQQLTESLIGEITENQIKIYLPADENYNLNSIIPTFVSSTLSTVYMNNQIQESEISVVNFSDIVNYQIQAEDLSLSENWTVEINISESFTDIFQELELFPNPVNSTLYFNSTENITKLSIFTAAGILIYSNNYITNNQIITKELAEGFYFLKLESGTKFITKKILVKH